MEEDTKIDEGKDEKRKENCSDCGCRKFIDRKVIMNKSKFLNVLIVVPQLAQIMILLLIDEKVKVVNAFVKVN